MRGTVVGIDLANVSEAAKARLALVGITEAAPYVILEGKTAPEPMVTVLGLGTSDSIAVPASSLQFVGTTDANVEKQIKLDINRVTVGGITLPKQFYNVAEKVETLTRPEYVKLLDQARLAIQNENVDTVEKFALRVAALLINVANKLLS